MAGEVGIVDVQGLLNFEFGALGAGQHIAGIGQSTHTELDLLPGGARWPLADVVGAVADLRRVNEEAITRLASWATDAVRGIAGLAYVSRWVAVNFPATDSASAEQLSRLQTQATDAMPAPPAGLPDPDPRVTPRRA